MIVDQHHLLECILWPNGDGTYRKIINRAERLRKLSIYNDYKLTIPVEHGVHQTMHRQFEKGTEFERIGDNAPMYGKGYLLTGEKSSMYGKTGEKHPTWKGDSAKPCAKYRRALKEYRRNTTEENLAALKEARLNRQEYKRLRKATS